MRTIYSTLLAGAIMIGFSACTGGGASTENPQIKLKGSTNIQIPLGTRNIPEGGFTASDVKDGDLTNHVKREHNIDFEHAGTYQITYFVVDSDGNRGQAIRQVTVKENNGGYYGGGQQQYRGSVPVIAFPDGNPVHLDLGQEFNGAYSATDFEDGDLGAVVEIGGAGIDASTPAGKYRVTYTVTDSDGNTVSKDRIVIVGDWKDSSNNYNQTLSDFNNWYSRECGKTINSSLYNEGTGYYNGTISCANRNFTSVDLSSLGVFSVIKKVDLSHNALMDIDLSQLSHVREIDLSHNDLDKNIDYRPLQVPSEVTKLLINGNNQLDYTRAERDAIFREIGRGNQIFIGFN